MIKDVSNSDKYEMDKILYKGTLSNTVRELCILVEQSMEILFKYNINP